MTYKRVINPLKTSEISKLLKSSKSLKEKFSFHLKTCLIADDREIGGARRDRTADLLRARQALSQLSYGPLTEIGGSGKIRTSDLTLIRGAL